MTLTNQIIPSPRHIINEFWLDIDTTEPEKALNGINEINKKLLTRPETPISQWKHENRKVIVLGLVEMGNSKDVFWRYRESDPNRTLSITHRIWDIRGEFCIGRNIN